MEFDNKIMLGAVFTFLERGKDVTINVKGRSMLPFLVGGRDKVVLTATKSGLHTGDAVLAELRPGQYVLHRIIALEGEDVTLMGDGNLRGTEHCKVQDVRGIVTQYIRPNRTILAADRSLQRRIRLWRKLLPVRRYLLFLINLFKLYK